MALSGAAYKALWLVIDASKCPAVAVSLTHFLSWLFLGLCLNLTGPQVDPELSPVRKGQGVGEGE